MRLSRVFIASFVVAACSSSDMSQSDSTRRETKADTTSVPATVAAPSVSKRTIVFVGTSLTAGLGLPPDSAYPAMIQEKIDGAGLPFAVVNAGVSGETTAGLLRRLDWVLKGDMDFIVLETGANDGLRGIDPATVRTNLTEIIAKIRSLKPSTRLLLVQMEALPNFGPRYTGRFRDIYVDLAKANGLTLLPFLLDGVAGRPELNQGDGVHPNLEGERVVAENIWRGLQPVLAGQKQ